MELNSFQWENLPRAFIAGDLGNWLVFDVHSWSAIGGGGGGGGGGAPPADGLWLIGNRLFIGDAVGTGGNGILCIDGTPGARGSALRFKVLLGEFLGLGATFGGNGGVRCIKIELN